MLFCFAVVGEVCISSQGNSQQVANHLTGVCTHLYSQADLQYQGRCESSLRQSWKFLFGATVQQYYRMLCCQREG
uniref:Uncharacterized protein n=1 Tax=Anguilla anguilla TaxID=7936 RepID=A0A0E9T140_ANGAN